MSRQKRVSKHKSDIIAAWDTLMFYADKIDSGGRVDMSDHEMLLIGQIMAAKDRRDWLFKLTTLLRPKAQRPYTFNEIYKLIEKEREEYAALIEQLQQILKYMPDVTLENIDGEACIPMEELLKLRSMIVKKN